MSAAASASAAAAATTARYLARKENQRQRVRILYRRALKETLNWAVHRHLFYKDASDLRERFDANKNVEDLDTIDKMIEEGEAAHNKWRHPDPYIVPWAPGGSKFTRNPTPPEGNFKNPEMLILGSSILVLEDDDVFLKMILGIDIVYDYGREDND